MKITILNGGLENTVLSWSKYLTKLVRVLTNNGHTVHHFILKDKDLNHCTGCFKCWVKTPGKCIIADDNQMINRAVINSDLVLFASPLVMGFVTSLLKKKMDRMIPLVHPYLVVEGGEIHHLSRYEKYPLFGLLVQPEKMDNDDTLSIVTRLFTRTTRNIKSRLAFSVTTSESVESLAARIENCKDEQVEISGELPELEVASIDPPHRMAVFNGSPRGKNGNTPVLLDHIMRGFSAVGGNSAEIFHLQKIKDKNKFAKAFAGAEAVLTGFPLYTDGMPGIVKEFFEELEIFTHRKHNPPIAFLVQSGFPEAHHSRYVEKYLASLTARLHSPYLGTLVRGGCEGVRMQPEKMNRKLFNTLRDLGNQLATKGAFEETSVKAFCSREKYSPALLPLISLLEKTPVLQMYWNKQLKKNNVFADRYARPYEGLTIDP